MINIRTMAMMATSTKARVLRADDADLNGLFDDSPATYVLMLTGRTERAAIAGSHIEIAAIVRRLAAEARHQLAGSGVSTTPEYSLPVYAIAAQLQYAGQIPDEDGALIAAGQVVDWLRTAGFDVVTRQDEPPEEPSLPVLGPSSYIVAELLEPGRAVLREVEKSRGGRWIAPSPCCDRWARLPAPPDADDDEAEQDGEPVFCNACKILYTVRLQEDLDDGWGPAWLALFKVVDTRVTTATRNYHKAAT